MCWALLPRSIFLFDHSGFTTSALQHNLVRLIAAWMYLVYLFSFLVRAWQDSFHHAAVQEESGALTHHGLFALEATPERA